MGFCGALLVGFCIKVFISGAKRSDWRAAAPIGHPWLMHPDRARSRAEAHPPTGMRSMAPPVSHSGYSYLPDALIKACSGRNLRDWPNYGGENVIGLLQRVTEASVSVDGGIIGEIGPGLVVLVAVHRDDAAKDIARLAERILGYRVFPDAEGRMNRSVSDVGGGLLLVPQFTLAADTKKGTRASFTRAAAPDMGREYFDRLVTACRERLDSVATGEFGADMQVSLINDGPVTFWLES